MAEQAEHAPKLFRHLKIKVDSDRHRMGQFILTGSQKFNLMKEVSDSLAGRAAILNLENHSTRELALTPIIRDKVKFLHTAEFFSTSK